MACAITKGRGIGCKNAFAGIKNVYILDYDSTGGLAVSALSDSSGTVTLPTDNSAEFFKFEVKGGQSSLETSVNSSRENGTTFYESTLNVTFQTLDVATQEEIKLLNRGRALYVIELYPPGSGNIKYLLLGKANGAEVTGGTIVTGAAPGDLQGFTITAVATEVHPPFFCTAPDVASISSIDPDA
tara:strand:- start:975 stop:1529 length:555 start_codon:yes stop_codon:yes gene_type:complete